MGRVIPPFPPPPVAFMAWWVINRMLHLHAFLYQYVKYYHTEENLADIRY